MQVARKSCASVIIMAKIKGAYQVKPLTEEKKNIIAFLIEEYDMETADDIQEAAGSVCLAEPIYDGS